MKNVSTLLEKGLLSLLIILNAVFLYYWVALSANYCLHYDDVHFLWKMRDYSIFEFVKEMYMTRGGNFVTYTLDGVIFTISNWIGAYRFWPMVFYALGILITWGAFRDTPWIKKSGYKGWLGIITLYNLYIFTSIDYAVFTWICAAVFYLYGPLLCLLMRYIHKESLIWWQWILFVVVAISIAGLSVSISTVTFMVMFIYGMYTWYSAKWSVRDTWNKPQIKRLIGITILMLICFAIVYVAPGNWARFEDEFDIEQPSNLMEFIKAITVCMGMFVYLMSFYIPYLLISITLGALAGMHYPMSLPFTRKKAIVITLLVALAYLFISVLPLAYLNNGFQIQRNYHPICYMLILTFFMVGYLWTNGTRIGDNKKKDISLYVCTYVCTIFLIVIMSINIHIDLPIAREYKKAHDERRELLLKLKEAGNKDLVYVDRYPSIHTIDAKYCVLRALGKHTAKPAIFYESDNSTIPNEYEYHVKKLYNLDFDFVIKE